MKNPLFILLAGINLFGCTSVDRGPYNIEIRSKDFVQVFRSFRDTASRYQKNGGHQYAASFEIKGNDTIIVIHNRNIIKQEYLDGCSKIDSDEVFFYSHWGQGMKLQNLYKISWLNNSPIEKEDPDGPSLCNLSFETMYWLKNGKILKHH